MELGNFIIPEMEREDSPLKLSDFTKLDSDTNQNIK